MDCTWRWLWCWHTFWFFVVACRVLHIRSCKAKFLLGVWPFQRVSHQGVCLCTLLWRLAFRMLFCHNWKHIFFFAAFQTVWADAHIVYHDGAYACKHRLALNSIWTILTIDGIIHYSVIYTDCGCAHINTTRSWTTWVLIFISISWSAYASCNFQWHPWSLHEASWSVLVPNSKISRNFHPSNYKCPWQRFLTDTWTARASIQLHRFQRVPLRLASSLQSWVQNRHETPISFWKMLHVPKSLQRSSEQLKNTWILTLPNTPNFYSNGLKKWSSALHRIG